MKMHVEVWEVKQTCAWREEVCHLECAHHTREMKIGELSIHLQKLANEELIKLEGRRKDLKKKSLHS